MTTTVQRARLRTKPPTGAPAPRVDRTGHGAILGASLMAAGPALGHGFEIDGLAIDQVAELAEGVPGRWTHGNLCADGLGTHLGRWRNVRRVGEQAVGDFHFSASAHKVQPEGLSVNAPTYLMDLAESEPDVLGVSAVIDFEVEEVELEEGSGETRRLARIHKVARADYVADPAANPSGLFSSTPSALAEQATELLEEVEGRYGESRVRGFLSSYLAEKSMATDDEPKGETKGEQGAPGNGDKARSKITEAEDKGFTIQEIAEATDRSPSVVSAIKAGEIDNPPDDFLTKIDALLEGSPPARETQEADMSATTTLEQKLATAQETIETQRSTIESLEARLRKHEEERLESYLASLSARCEAANVLPLSQEERSKVTRALGLDEELGRELAEAIVAKKLAAVAADPGQGERDLGLDNETSAELEERRKFIEGLRGAPKEK